MRTSENEYQEITEVDHVRHWELLDGHLREKPGLTWEAAELVSVLSSLLFNQLDRREYRVRIIGRVRRPGTILRPGVCVVPTPFGEEFRGRPDVPAIFSEPLPLVVDVWSRSTGDYDVDVKVPIYQRRGDLEIWRIHPYDQTVTVWRRQEDGSYDESVYRDGIIRLAAVPSVTIEVEQLFDE
jgi:Uma2 family endonuclease